VKSFAFKRQQKKFMEEKWLSNLLLDSLTTLFQFKRFCSFETDTKIVINDEKWTYSRSFQNKGVWQHRPKKHKTNLHTSSNMAKISKVYLINIGLSHINFIDTDILFTSGELSTMCGRRLEEKRFSPGKKSNSRNGIYNASKVYMWAG